MAPVPQPVSPHPAPAAAPPPPEDASDDAPADAPSGPVLQRQRSERAEEGSLLALIAAAEVERLRLSSAEEGGSADGLKEEEGSSDASAPGDVPPSGPVLQRIKSERAETSSLFALIAAADEELRQQSPKEGKAA